MTNETIEDILREMRKEAEVQHDAYINDPLDETDREELSRAIVGFSDRIEAAHKRMVSREGNVGDKSSVAGYENLKMLINGIVRPHEVDVALEKVGKIVNDLIDTKNAIYYWLVVYENKSKGRDKLRKALGEVLDALQYDNEYGASGAFVLEDDDYKSEWRSLVDGEDGK